MTVQTTFPTALLLLLAACNRDNVPCPTCDGEDQAEQEEGSLPDLPCGGADLLTDDLNCGTCGNECAVMWPDTDYAAGGCIAGECGPLWSGAFTLLPLPDMATCEQLCGFGDVACVPKGCSGMTGFVCVIVGDFGDQCDLGKPTNHATIELTGACDEVIPYPNGLEPSDYPNFACCCERP